MHEVVTFAGSARRIVQQHMDPLKKAEGRKAGKSVLDGSCSSGLD